MVRFNRANLDSTLTAATKLAKSWGYAKYVFATANGFVIADAKPPFNQQYYRITTEGQISYTERDVVTNITTTTIVR